MKATPEHLHLREFYDLQVAEDEFHFVFHCLLYSDLRNSLFKSIQFKNADVLWKHEGESLCCWFENVAFALAKFIEKTWWYRQQSILYPIRQTIFTRLCSSSASNQSIRLGHRSGCLTLKKTHQSIHQRNLSVHAAQVWEFREKSGKLERGNKEQEGQSGEVQPDSVSL